MRSRPPRRPPPRRRHQLNRAARDPVAAPDRRRARLGPSTKRTRRRVLLARERLTLAAMSCSGRPSPSTGTRGELVERAADRLDLRPAGAFAGRVHEGRREGPPRWSAHRDQLARPRRGARKSGARAAGGRSARRTAACRLGSRARLAAIQTRVTAAAAHRSERGDAVEDAGRHAAKVSKDSSRRRHITDSTDAPSCLDGWRCGCGRCGSRQRRRSTRSRMRELASRFARCHSTVFSARWRISAIARGVRLGDELQDLLLARVRGSSGTGVVVGHPSRTAGARPRW